MNPWELVEFPGATRGKQLERVRRPWLLPKVAIEQKRAKSHRGSKLVKLGQQRLSVGGSLRCAVTSRNTSRRVQVPKTGETIRQFIEAVETMPGLSKLAVQVVILVTGAHFNAAYELYAHAAVATQAGLSDVQIATLSSGDLPKHLDAESTLAER